MITRSALVGYAIAICISVSLNCAQVAEAQEDASTESPAPEDTLQAEAGANRNVVVGTTVAFDSSASRKPDPDIPYEVLWDFGDGIRTTGDAVTHAYARSGTYRVQLRITSADVISQDTTEVHVFDRSLILVADASAAAEQLELRRQQAAQAGVLLIVLQATAGNPEVITEDDLSEQLTSAVAAIARAPVIITWTSGGVGANALTKLAQHLRQSGEASSSLYGQFSNKGIIMLTETPLAVLAPAAQTTFDQLQPDYVLLTRPTSLELIATAPSSEAAKERVVASGFEYRLLGTFSARTLRDIGPTNFMSFGLSYLVNRGIPINSLLLILMIPVIATILAFARQVIGIKAFGLITPTMTSLSFLVMGLRSGLLVFAAVLLAGTLTRMALRRLRLLYVPRMALVLTSVSLGILLLLSVDPTRSAAHLLSFSIFPILTLITLAEEFIAVQFKSGAKNAFTITAWTLLLSILGYFVVSWELLRTLLLSYPEFLLLTIPINLLLGRWTGLRLTEYFRFRQLLRYGRSTL